MRDYETVTLSRDVESIQIPGGYPVDLTRGSQVTITQSLGGSYTVMTDQGYLVRIAGKDADAIGKEPAGGPAGDVSDVSAEALEEQVWEQLRTCYDPEIPVNIVELGLVYSLDVKPLPEGGHRVGVDFTLTAPGCGMGDILKMDIEERIASLPGVKEVNANVVFEPVWEPSRMSEAAKLELGMPDW